MGSQAGSCLDFPQLTYMKKYTIPNTDIIEIAMLSNIMLGSPKNLGDSGPGDTTTPINPWGAPARNKPF